MCPWLRPPLIEHPRPPHGPRPRPSSTTPCRPPTPCTRLSTASTWASSGCTCQPPRHHRPTPPRPAPASWRSPSWRTRRRPGTTPSTRTTRGSWSCPRASTDLHSNTPKYTLTPTQPPSGFCLFLGRLSIWLPDDSCPSCHGPAPRPSGQVVRADPWRRVFVQEVKHL